MAIPGARLVSGREEESEEPPRVLPQAPRVGSQAPGPTGQMARAAGNRPTPETSGSRDSGASFILGARPTTPAQPTFQERANTAAGGLSASISESLPVSGAISGALAFSPGGPLASIVGGAGGLILGYTGRNVLNDAGYIPQPEELPPELRPFHYGGEVIGAGATMTAAPFQAAAQGARFSGKYVGNFFNKILDTATRKPGTFLGAEVSSTLGSAGAEGMAEAVRPGDTVERIGSGIVGGLVNPSSILFGAGSAAGDALQRVTLRFSPQARTTRAGRLLTDIIQESGGDPQALAVALREADLPGANRTAAQLTGSPALQALEASLSRGSAQFGAQSQHQANEALTSMRNMIGLLEETGDPAALQEAARVRQQYFDELLQGRFKLAEAQAGEAAQGISRDDPAEVARLSRRTSEIVDDALSQARTAERQLYEKVPDGPATGANIQRVAEGIKSDMLLPEEPLPPLIARRLGALDEAEGATSIHDLRLFRTRMLDSAREAAAKGDYSDARIFGNMADAALEDLAVLDVPELTEARAFSQALNDNFTRTFAGESQATRASGAARIAPEALLRRATAGGHEMAAIRLGELSRAVQFGAPEAAEELLDIQQRVVRNAAAATVDPETGQISLRRLATFRRNNADVLEQMPEVNAILRDASTARRLFDETTARGSLASKAISQQAAFARVAGAENPTRVVGEMLRGRNPQRDFAQLARMARREGDDAVAGLRRATLDDAFARAGGNQEGFSFSRYEQLLTQPSRPGQPSTLDTMRRNGVIDADTEKRLVQLLGEARKVEGTLAAKPELEQMLGQENALFDALIRVAGAASGSRAMNAAGGTGPGSIVAAGIGSQFAQKVFERIPDSQTQHVLMEAAQNPRFMATLLETPRSRQHAIELGRRANVYLYQAGLVRGPQDLAPAESEPEPTESERQEDAQRGTLTP